MSSRAVEARGCVWSAAPQAPVSSRMHSSRPAPNRLHNRLISFINSFLGKGRSAPGHLAFSQVRCPFCGSIGRTRARPGRSHRHGGDMFQIIAQCPLKSDGYRLFSLFYQRKRPPFSGGLPKGLISLPASARRFAEIRHPAVSMWRTSGPVPTACPVLPAGVRRPGTGARTCPRHPCGR